MPSLILGEEAAQLTTTYIHSEIIDDVGADMIWRRRNAREVEKTFVIDGARIFSDVWQAGISFPLKEHANGGRNFTGLADISGSLTYEYLTDWDYNPWRPHGLGFFQLVAPTGRSVTESQAAGQLDARGGGFWTWGFGTLLAKAWASWDAYVLMQAHRSFSRDYRTEQATGRLHPGQGGLADLGVGFNWDDFRLGCGLNWAYEDPVRVSGSMESNGAAKRFTTSSVSLNYLFSREWAASLIYSDQTLFGHPMNISLERSGGISLQRRWLR